MHCLGRSGDTENTNPTPSVTENQANIYVYFTYLQAREQYQELAERSRRRAKQTYKGEG